jgi:ArsR family transcriptional regulator
MQRGAEVFKALGHPTRLAMISDLDQGEQCVCDLHELVGGDLSTVSNHLAVLRHAGLVKSERRGTQVFYALRMRCILDVLRCVNRFEEC